MSRHEADLCSIDRISSPFEGQSWSSLRNSVTVVGQLLTKTMGRERGVVEVVHGGGSGAHICGLYPTLFQRF